jgi:hypothetical protein
MLYACRHAYAANQSTRLNYIARSKDILLTTSKLGNVYVSCLTNQALRGKEQNNAPKATGKKNLLELLQET